MTSSEALMAPAITAEQKELVKRTIAPDATPDELKLFFYDCARQGVSPLDKLIHFTKRGGRYTPITSIDFMRMRAAETNEYAGSDDAVFEGTPKGADFAAHVTVYRLVQGQRCAFSATARWSEYCPVPGQDHMWRKMPFTMLAKCCEALALRKGFPRQLAGLYAKEELDQAEVVEGKSTPSKPPEPELNVDALEAEARAVVDRATLPSDAVTVVGVKETAVKSKKDNREYRRFLVTLSTGEQAATLSEFVASLAKQFKEQGVPVKVKTRLTQYGLDLLTIAKASEAGESLPLEKEPVNLDDIPF